MSEYPKLVRRFIAEQEQKGGHVLTIEKWEGTNCIKYTGVMDFPGWNGLAIFESETVEEYPPSFKSMFVGWNVIEQALEAKGKG